MSDKERLPEGVPETEPEGLPEAESVSLPETEETAESNEPALTAEPKAPMSPKKKKIIVSGIASALALVLVLTGVLVAVFACSNPYYDYKNKDLTPYVTVTSDMLAGYTVKVDPRKVYSDADVMADIERLMKEEGEKKNLPDTVPTDGDSVSVLFRVQYDGKEIYNFTNYLTPNALLDIPMHIPAEGETDTLLSYYAPLRLALREALMTENKAPSSYYLKETNTGFIGQGAVVYTDVTLEYTKDHVEKKENYPALRIELPQTTEVIPSAVSPYDFIPDGVYRELLRDLVGVEMKDRTESGPPLIGDVYVISEGVTYSYTAEPLFTADEKALNDVKVTLPEDFDKGGDLAYLGGKEVSFILIPVATVQVEIPAFTDAYVEELTSGGYKGEGAAAAFFKDWKAYLQATEDAAFEERLFTALTKVLTEKVKPTDYPEEALEDARRELYGVFQSSYDGYVSQYGTSQFPTLESYLDYTFEAKTDEEREEFITTLIEGTVSDYLIFYAAAKHLNVMPTDDEVRTAVSDTVKNMSESDLNGYQQYFGDGYLERQVEYAMVREAVLDALPYENSAEK